MYAVIGADGVVYGPVPVGELLAWAAQGRVTADTLLIDWQGRRLPAGSLPELQRAFMPAVAYGPPPKKKSTVYWLIFFLGPYGGHRFYLGHTGTGVAMLVLGLATFWMCSLPTLIWCIVDASMVASGQLREASGRALV